LHCEHSKSLNSYPMQRLSSKFLANNGFPHPGGAVSSWGLDESFSERYRKFMGHILGQIKQGMRAGDARFCGK
jgi:hypothetical protein